MTRSLATVAEGAAVAAAFARYKGVVLPRVRRELGGWRRAAALIPDPELREQASLALAGKAANVEATGVLSILAPARSRPAVIRASTALQVAVDYLDSLGEQPGPDPLGDGLELHGALAAALEPGGEGRNWYAHHPQQQDGGYLNLLVGTCSRSAASLPSATTILPLARRAAIRCGEGQSHTHAAAGSSSQGLQRWAAGLTAPAGFEWWEVAAGASSSVAAHALLALAGSTGATRTQGELVNGAYSLAIGALTVLLDDLVDREADEAAGEHSYLRHYPSDAAGADRLEAVVELARQAIDPLPAADRHRAILSGVLAFYLSSPGAVAPGTRAIHDRLLSSSGLVVRALAGVLGRKRPGPGEPRPGL